MTFFAVLVTRRNASSPGLYPKPSQFLFKNFHACFKRCKIAIQWRRAQVLYIPKVSTPSDTKLSDFRPIALLNVEGKRFFSLISQRLETHLIYNNTFINNSIQKTLYEESSWLLGASFHGLACLEGSKNP